MNDVLIWASIITLALLERIHAKQIDMLQQYITEHITEEEPE